MADLNVTADFTDIEQLQRLLGELGPAFGRTVARIQRESKQLEKATEASANVINRALNEVVGAKAQRDLETWGAAQKRRLALMSESEKIAQRQAAAEKAITQELVRQRDAADSLAAANAQRFQSQIGSNLGVGAQGISAGASAGAFEAEIERLRLKYDQIYASSQLYERSLNELNTAHRLGAISTLNHAKAVDQLNLEYQQFQSGAVVGFNRFQSAQQQAEFGANRMGVVVQQAGYQVGDFIVQVQSGTNWMVAFGQQATQLAGLMTTFGGSFIAIGTALGITIPLVTALGAAWMRTREAQDGATESAKRLAEAQKALSDATYNAEVELDKLRFGVDEQYQVELLREQVRLRDENTAKLAEYNSYVATTTDSLDRQKIVTAEMLEVLQSQVAAFNDIQSKLDRQEQLSATLALNERVRQAATETTAKLIKEIADREAERVAIGERIHAAMIASQGALERTSKFSKLLREEMEKAGISTVKLSDTDIASGIWGGAAAALALADRLGIALANAKGLAGIANYEASGGPDEARRRNALTMGKEGGVLASGAGGVFTGSSGGGGGGGSGGNSRLESLISELQTEQETLAIWYEESQVALQSASDKELEILGGKYEAKIRLEEEYQERLKEILGSESNYRLAEMGNMFSSLADLAGIGGKKMLKVQATLSAAGATIAAYETAIKAAAEAKTIPGRIAAYAKFLAVGLGAVAQIRQAGGVGGGGGGGSRGSVGSASVAAAAPDPRPQTVYIDSLQPDGLYTGQTLINLFDALYDENDRRGKVFVVGRG